MYREGMGFKVVDRESHIGRRDVLASSRYAFECDCIELYLLPSDWNL